MWSYAYIFLLILFLQFVHNVVTKCFPMIRIANIILLMEFSPCTERNNSILDLTILIDHDHVDLIVLFI